jgi:hypothetical protein
MAKRYGDDAMIEAEVRAQKFLDASEMGGAETWHRILNAVDRIRSESNGGIFPSDDWNSVLANQTMSALWLTHSDEATRDRQYGATRCQLAGVGPNDELEGMIAAQLIAAHNAAMEK